MSVAYAQNPEQVRRVVVLTDLLAGALEASVLGIVARDDRGVFVVPHPGVAVSLFEYLASVNWKTVVMEAQEHWVEP